MEMPVPLFWPCKKDMCPYFLNNADSMYTLLKRYIICTWECLLKTNLAVIVRLQHFILIKNVPFSSERSCLPQAPARFNLHLILDSRGYSCSPPQATSTILKTLIDLFILYKPAVRWQVKIALYIRRSTSAGVPQRSVTLQNLVSRSKIHFTAFCSGLSVLFFAKCLLDVPNIRYSRGTRGMLFIAFQDYRWFIVALPRYP